MINLYFFWFGVAINLAAAISLLACLWVWFVWPFVEACSFTRCLVKALGKGRVAPIWKILIYSYADFIFGRQWTAKHGNKWTWRGVGDWTTHNEGDSCD